MRYIATYFGVNLLMPVDETGLFFTAKLRGTREEADLSDICATLEAAVGVQCRPRTSEIDKTFRVDAFAEGTGTRATIVLLSEDECFANEPSKPLLSALAPGRELATMGWGPMYISLAHWRSIRRTSDRERYLERLYRDAVQQGATATSAALPVEGQEEGGHEVAQLELDED